MQRINSPRQLAAFVGLVMLFGGLSGLALIGVFAILNLGEVPSLLMNGSGAASGMLAYLLFPYIWEKTRRRRPTKNAHGGVK